MKRIILPIFIALALAACKPDAPELPECLTAASGFVAENCPDQGTCDFRYYECSTLEVTDGEFGIQKELKAGENQVFHFEFTKIVSPLIMDAGYSESIWFEVKPEGNSFLIEQKDLEKAGALFGRSCFCPDVGLFQITQGCIYGRKTGKHRWEVTLNVTASGEYTTWNRMKQCDFVRSARPDLP